MIDEIKIQAETAIKELIETAKLKKGSIVVIGCSSSEISGKNIGSNSSMELAESVFNGVYPILKQNGIYLATQCCEHLNRTIITEKELAQKIGADIVNVIPQPKAGGSFSTKAYHSFKNPVAIEKIKADAGIDIGGTLIGMHLKEVAVPVRISLCKIGYANIICARTRPKFVGGVRAVYDEKLF